MIIVVTSYTDQETDHIWLLHALLARMTLEAWSGQSGQGSGRRTTAHVPGQATRLPSNSLEWEHCNLPRNCNKGFI